MLLRGTARAAEMPRPGTRHTAPLQPPAVSAEGDWNIEAALPHVGELRGRLMKAEQHTGESSEVLEEWD